MISVIVSSFQPSFFLTLQESICSTIGTEYEIIQIDNPGIMGICEAYNRGAGLAKYEFLCFVHEDVIFKTKNWGKALVEKFISNKQIGLVGIAGSKYKSLSPGHGWYNNDRELDRLHLLQHKKQISEIIYENQIHQEYEEVVCLDGVFLFTRKSIWECYKFDEINFTKFHCYDLDFSLSVSRNYKVLVTDQVLLEHFSPGNPDKVWLGESIKLCKKWKRFLPLGDLPYNHKRQLEWKHKRWFIQEMTKHNYNTFEISRVLFGFGLITFFSLTGFAKSFKILLKNSIR